MLSPEAHECFYYGYNLGGFDLTSTVQVSSYEDCLYTCEITEGCMTAVAQIDHAAATKTCFLKTKDFSDASELSPNDGYYTMKSGCVTCAAGTIPTDPDPNLNFDNSADLLNGQAVE